jgi:hypothetical protein
MLDHDRPERPLSGGLPSYMTCVTHWGDDPSTKSDHLTSHRIDGCVPTGSVSEIIFTRP